MTYIGEYLGEDGTWCRKSYHRNQENAVNVAEVAEQSGYKTRIIADGRIVWEG